MADSVGLPAALPALLAGPAAGKARERKLSGGDARRVEGVVHLHDLWRTELF